MHVLIDRLLNAGFFEAPGGKDNLAAAAELPTHEEAVDEESNKAAHDEVADSELQQDGQLFNIHLLAQIAFVDLTAAENRF